MGLLDVCDYIEVYFERIKLSDIVFANSSVGILYSRRRAEVDLRLYLLLRLKQMVLKMLKN